MPEPCYAAWMLSIGAMVLGPGVVSGQNYPNRTVRIVAAEPGGGEDFVARLIAQNISGGLGQIVIVENRPANLVGEFVARAPSDGYTLLVAAGILWVGPLLRTTPYDPVRDFSPIAILARSPNVLVVHPSLPVHSVRELIALARTAPGQLNYASGGAGTTPHLAAELFKGMAGGLDMVHIPYKGSGPALNDLVGGQVQLMFPNMAAVAPHVKSGRLRALAVTTAEPSPLIPGLPTVAASGLPGYESELTTGMFAPSKTPAEVINRLNQEIVGFLNTTETRERFFNFGLATVGSSPEQLADKMKSEMAKWGKLIKEAGIRAN